MSELSGPDQSTTEPSEYVCRTVNVYVLLDVGAAEELEEGILTGRDAAAGPGHLLDHGVLAGAGLLHLPLPAGRGPNESIENPFGGVSSILVVVRFSFSVGTASVNTWPSPKARRRAYVGVRRGGGHDHEGRPS